MSIEVVDLGDYRASYTVTLDPLTVTAHPTAAGDDHADDEIRPTRDDTEAR